MTTKTLKAAGYRRPTPDEALQMMVDGNLRYRDDSQPLQDYSASGTARSSDQHPIAGILGCGDARVGAELIFDRGPGDLFMVRLAGNFLSDYGLASLEYAVEFLDAPLLMVLGHTKCGAVTAAIQVVEEKADLPGRLFVLIDAIEPSVLHAKMTNPDDLLRAATEENVRRQVRRLRTASPLIKTAQEQDRVKVVGAIYDVDTGEVTLLS